MRHSVVGSNYLNTTAFTTYTSNKDRSGDEFEIVSQDNESRSAVTSAIIGNSLVTVAKFLAFLHTGSASMLSESIHSLADGGNQVLLFIGIKKSRKRRDASHPYGYLKEQYVWSMMSAMGLFFLGCGVSTYHGVSGLFHPHEVVSLPVALGVLGFSLIVEGTTLYVALKACRRGAKTNNMTLWNYVIKGPDPMATSVLMEDSVAIFGVVTAASCLSLTAITGETYWDSMGSIIIGGMLGTVATVIIKRNRSFLVGVSAPLEKKLELIKLLESDPVIFSVRDVKVEILGPNRTRLKAEIDFDGREIARRFLANNTHDLDAIVNMINLKDETLNPSVHRLLLMFGDNIIQSLAIEVDRIEANIKRHHPDVRHIDMETDRGDRLNDSYGYL